jgi:uracil phosphoribosyltransferase
MNRQDCLYHFHLILLIMPLHLVTHPLAQVILTELRDKNTAPPRFRRLCHRLTTLITLEASKDWETKAKVVDTPMEPHEGAELANGTVVVPILRAGLGMVEPILSLLPNAQVGHVGIERDHETALPRSYYAKLPPVEGQHFLMVDPMLATGGSALHAIQSLREAGVQRISLLCVIAAPEGVEAVLAVEPELPIYAAALDRCLNEKKYILPGIGDFGDRLMGT